MSGAITPLPQYAFMAWCSVKAQGHYLYNWKLWGPSKTSHVGQWKTDVECTNTENSRGEVYQQTKNGLTEQLKSNRCEQTEIQMYTDLKKANGRRPLETNTGGLDWYYHFLLNNWTRSVPNNMEHCVFS